MNAVDGPAGSILVGVPIDNLTMAQCLDALGELVDDGRAHGRGHQVATVNVDFLVNAIENQELHELLQSTSLNLADGLPLVWGAQLGGLPLHERVAGADLVPLLAAESERRGWHVHFFGSAPGVVERALDLLRERHPNAKLSGESGPMLSDPTNVDEAVLDSIAGHDADILCVALGNPKQEWFISSNLERLGCPVAIGIGGSLDMLVGDRRRAPEWAQRVGLEWVFRAIQEPKRLGPRYAHDAAVFFPHLVRNTKDYRQAGTTALSAERIDDQVVVASAPPTKDEAWTSVKLFDGGDPPTHVSVDLDNSALSAEAVAELAWVLRRATSREMGLSLSKPAGQLRDQLKGLELLGWYESIAESASQ